MTDQWRIKKINEVGRLVTGKTPSSSKPESFGDKYPFITPTDMHDCRYASSTARYLSEEGAAGQKTLRIPAGSVAVSCIGWQMGKSIVTTRPSFTNQQLHTILPNDEVDFLFLYYSLCTQRVELLSLGSAAGVRTPIINKSAFGLLSIAVPPLKIQRKIASILSAYDDLIENNTRRIAIQEEMAQAIYREWFVNFRFPGHENVKLVDSALGKIPEGWKELPLFDIVNVNYGKNLPTKQLDDSAPFPVYGAAKIIGRYTEFTRIDRTLICGCRGSVGEMQITLPQCFVTNNSFTFDLDEHSFFWLYHTLMWRGLRDVVSGSAQPQITLQGISSVQLSTPPKATRKAFNESVLPLFELKFCLEKKNLNLRTTRDLLLPKLISGQLDVEDLDIDMGMTAEELTEAAAG